MTAPVPEEENAALDLTSPPPGEHASEAPGADGGADDSADDSADDGVNETVDDQVDARQEENAESSLDQPSQ
ncbi:hypothetical protein GCM10023340_15570 [Nocardioides marinquilinus]|uniref:Uncharacterized protein n=1 Tax=Nocardioides marinquilinus TaxID=1210400 RepID=A0ABP9PJ28_9ACTN